MKEEEETEQEKSWSFPCMTNHTTHTHTNTHTSHTITHNHTQKCQRRAQSLNIVFQVGNFPNFLPKLPDSEVSDSKEENDLRVTMATDDAYIYIHDNDGLWRTGTGFFTLPGTLKNILYLFLVLSFCSFQSFFLSKNTCLH